MRFGIAERIGDRFADIARKDRLELHARPQDRNDRRGHHARKAIHELVLPPEHDRGTQDGGVREGVAHRRFTLPLGPGIGRRAIRIRADRRDMDERVRTGLARGLRHGARAIDMDRLHLAAHHADQIDDRIGPSTARATVSGRAMSAATNWVWPSPPCVRRK